MNCFPAETKNSAVDNFRRPVRNKGFTLIEVVIVIAIIGIVAGFTIPAVIQYRNNAKLRGVVINLNASLQRARFLAIKTNSSQEVMVCADRYTVYKTVSDTTDDRTLPPGVAIDLANTTFPQSAAKPSCKTVSFNGRGLPDNFPADPTISKITVSVMLTSSEEKTSAIDVNRLGLIKIP